VTAEPAAGEFPGSRFLTGVERAVSGQWTGPESLLRRAVDALSEDAWDAVMLDCPPTLGRVAVSALVAAREVLVPVEARVMALDGLVSLLTTLQQVREGTLNADLSPAMILPVRVDRTRLAKPVTSSILSGPGSRKWCCPRLSVTISAWPRPPRGHLAISQYAPGSSGADDYRALAVELIARVEVAA
jgi:chromosome partitioning protein